MKYTKAICVKCTIVVVLMMLTVPGWAVVKQEDTSPGKAVVIYDDNEVLGGGWIDV